MQPSNVTYIHIHGSYVDAYIILINTYVYTYDAFAHNISYNTYLPSEAIDSFDKRSASIVFLENITVHRKSLCLPLSFRLEFRELINMPPRTAVETQQRTALEDTPLLVERTDRVDESDLNASETFSFARILQEMAVQSKTALPTLQSMVFTKIPWLISLRFVGGMGAPQLAAAALATTLCNVTGMALSVGLSSALSTLAGQAKGELASRMLHDKHRRVSFDMAQSARVTKSLELIIDSPSNDEPITTIVFFWRGMVIQLCVMLPVALWWLTGIESTLLYLGQTQLLSTMTQDYLRVLSPRLIGYSIGWT